VLEINGLRIPGFLLDILFQRNRIRVGRGECSSSSRRPEIPEVNDILP